MGLALHAVYPAVCASHVLMDEMEVNIRILAGLSEK